MENKNEKNNFERDFVDDERLNMAPPPKPFTKMKIIEIIACLVAVILGLLYLNTSLIPLGVLLVVYCAFFSAIPILRGIDAKKSGGGFVAFLPAMCWGVLAVCLIAVTIAYFVM